MGKCIFCSKPLSAFDYLENTFSCPACGSYTLQNDVYELLKGDYPSTKYDIVKLKSSFARYLSAQRKISPGCIHICAYSVDALKCSNGVILDEVYMLYDK